MEEEDDGSCRDVGLLAGKMEESAIHTLMAGVAQSKPECSLMERFQIREASSDSL